MPSQHPLLSLCLFLATAVPVHSALAASPPKQDITSEIAAAMKTADRMLKRCKGQPKKDPFAKSSASVQGGEAASWGPLPTFQFLIKPRLSSSESSTFPTTRLWGGFLGDATKYDADNEVLKVALPLDGPFMDSHRPRIIGYKQRYAVINIAERGEQLPKYQASNAYGATIQIDPDRTTIWRLVVHNTEALNWLYAKNEDWLGHEYTTHISPNDARQLVPALAWEIVANTRPLQDSDCVAQDHTFQSRTPKIDNPWEQITVHIDVPVELKSLRLIDTRSGITVWSLPIQ